MAAWWLEFEVYVEGSAAAGERRMANNHGSWFDTTWLSVARFNGNATAVQAASREVNEKRVARQINSTGQEWIELERNVPSGCSGLGSRKHPGGLLTKSTAPSVQNTSFLRLVFVFVLSNTHNTNTKHTCCFMRVFNGLSRDSANGSSRLSV